MVFVSIKMQQLWFTLFTLSLVGLPMGYAGSIKNSSLRVYPFKVDLSENISRMLNLVDNTRLPEAPEYPDVGGSSGMDLEFLKSLQNQWIHDYNWDKDQSYINSFQHFTITIEGRDIHFIHEESKDPNAIPLILFHGWPDGTAVSFNIVIPSLPGFAFSSAPPANWTIDDTANVMNILMVDALGYEKYAVHGTDWGSGIAYSLYDHFSQHVRAAHFAFIPFYPLDFPSLAAINITLNPLEIFEESNFITWSKTGSAYFEEMTTEPNTIGLALYDNPIGQLAWIGQKLRIWSDPRRGTPPSVLTDNEILRTVTLYYLTRSFISSAYIYAQNPNGFKQIYTKAHTDAPLLFSAFKYNIGFWPPALVAKVGNLVSYKNHEFGGHFPGLDNPIAMVEDLRDIAKYWT